MMIELIIKNFLSQKMTVPVLLEIPSPPPEEFLLIEHTGGGDTGKLLCSAMIAVQSYGQSLAAAAELNEALKIAMRELPALAPICKVNLNSDYNFTDTASRRYRYQAVFDIIYYREE